MDVDDERGQYYLHNFAAQQPDLNWWNPEVAPEFERILRFWFDRGVAGFRIDVAHAIFKDRELRDDPVDPRARHASPLLDVQARDARDPAELAHACRDVRPAATPPRRGVLARRRAVGRLLRQHGDELDLAFAFMLTHADLDAAQMRTVVAEVEAALPADAWPCWTGSNHDIGRLATRWADGDDARVRCALMMLLTLRGTPCLYYGDELASRGR